jgi:hypothetical protein
VQLSAELVELAIDSFVVHFQGGIEPQNTEQGIMQVEVWKNKNTSYLYISCSIFKNTAKFFK